MKKDYEIKIKDSFPLLPRERLMAYGADQLSETELLAILLRTGTREEDVLQLAKRILTRFETLSDFRTASLSELQQIEGIGAVKAIEIKAMMELGKRIQAAQREVGFSVYNSSDLAKKMNAEMSDLTQEHLVAIYLDNRNRIIQKKTIFVGTVNSAPANPREILHYAVKLLSSSLLVVHNHPSGIVSPSSDDRAFTEKLHVACCALGTSLVDHLIVGGGHYYSFHEHHQLLE